MAEEERANGFMEEAHKKIESSKTFFGSMFGGRSKIEDAAELYLRAANSYKMAKKWSAAGKAFTEVAKLQLEQLQSKHEAAQQYVEASKCYRKGDFQEAVECLERAIEIFTDMGRFSIAAKHHVSIAEIYESTGLLDVDQAIIHYTQAADYFKGEESSSAANKCLLKVAMYAAQQEDYKKAINIYEEVAAVSIESDLLKYSAREYFFKATLARMCDCMETDPDSPDSIQGVTERYCQMFPAFEDSREMKLLQKIVEAHMEDSVDSFTAAVSDYDAISRLDQWYTTLLLRIKNKITGGSGGGGEADGSGDVNFDDDLR